MMDHVYEQIINMSYAHFASCPATPPSIRDYIDRMKRAFPEQEIDSNELFLRLEAIHSVSIEEDAKILEDKSDHEEWFNPDTNRPLKKDFEWHFWDHYCEYLKLQKKWTDQIVQGLDRFSSMALSRMEEPHRTGAWDRRGMVVGNVQSGKTANYTALITKATDAGYKLVVVLAGVHNSLRSQTQERVNEEFLGYDLDIVKKITGQEKRIGVRRMFRNNHRVVNTLTSSAINGDFSANIASQAGIIPSMTGDPIILITKKNVSILRNIIEWSTSLGELTSSGRKIVREVPLLLIDDECDYASVNTKKPERDEHGAIIEEWDPAKTNLLIRELLRSFERSIYIGYTATPFANIFIHKDDPHPIYGDDLFPKHFLISLPQPSNYIGPDEVFGLKEDPDIKIDVMEPLPLVREVDDNEDIIPSNIKNDASVDFLPDSLSVAIKSFVLVCAARRLRSVGVPHNSMLVHVARFTRIQGQVKELIEAELKTLTARIMNKTDKLDDLQDIWESDFAQTSRAMKDLGFSDARLHSWKEIESELYEAVKPIRIKGMNGEVGDTLEYREADKKTKDRMEKGEQVPWYERGIDVIAIGGDKLSRGLTLDGLSISYYLRSARMYDTLMQMGRWFGYHDGYCDLCRIYTTDELIEWYRHIALASKELRNEFDYMESIGSTPENFGLKVRSHPGRLAITSAGKSRATERMAITFSGSLQQSIIFNPRKSSGNVSALESLINSIGREPDREFNPAKPRFHWENVDPSIIITFLQRYTTHAEAKQMFDPKKMADYIKRQVKKEELTNWHVVVVSNREQDRFHSTFIAGYEISCVQRTPIINKTEKVSIGVLTSTGDVDLDMEDMELERARLEHEATGGTLSKIRRKYRPSTRGLFLIYLPAYKSDNGKEGYGLAGDELVGFAISFPESDTAVPKEYVVNSVYAED